MILGLACGRYVGVPAVISDTNILLLLPVTLEALAASARLGAQG